MIRRIREWKPYDPKVGLFILSSLYFLCSLRFSSRSTSLTLRKRSEAKIKLLSNSLSESITSSFPFLTTLVDVKDVFANAHYGVHVVGIDDSRRVKLPSDVVNEVVDDE